MTPLKGHALVHPAPYDHLGHGPTRWTVECECGWQRAASTRREAARFHRAHKAAVRDNDVARHARYLEWVARVAQRNGIPVQPVPDGFRLRCPFIADHVTVELVVPPPPQDWR